MENYVHALTMSGNALYAGGYSTTAGGSGANYIAQWNGTTWSALGLGGKPGLNDSVLALAVSSNMLYAGGAFNSAGNSPVNCVAQWNGISWSPLGLGIGGGDLAGPYVKALAVSGDTLYAGGDFTTAGGASVQSIAQWNGTNWSALGSGLSWGGIDLPNVQALAVSGTNLYVGGWFTMAGGVPARGIAQWNGSSWSALGSGVNNYVDALAVSGGTLYAGGWFTTAGGSPANYVAQWDGGAWSPLGGGISGADNGYGPYVYALAVSGGTLYVGGVFTTAGGISAANIAQWNGNSWSGLGSGMGLYGYVNSLAVSEGTLYAGGNFGTAGGVPANYVAQWNGSNWSALGSGMNGGVSALAVSGGTLYAGGSFTKAGTNISAYAAQGLLVGPPSPLVILSNGTAFGITNGAFGFEVSGPAGSNVVIQGSADLQTWTSLQTNLFDSVPFYFSDASTNYHRFYRAVLH
jgi:trimeric autotransporter adhesin